MLKIENTEVLGWEHAIRGMRNPMNSWEKSDSGYCHRDFLRDCRTCIHGPLEKCWRKGYLMRLDRGTAVQRADYWRGQHRL